MKKASSRGTNLDGIRPMIPWKQALITAAGVYPLLLTYEWLVKYLLPVENIDRRITLLIVVVMIATTMVYLVMPLLIRILKNWLFNINNK